MIDAVHPATTPLVRLVSQGSDQTTNSYDWCVKIYPPPVRVHI
jgi:hypothetical protein